MRRKVLLAGLLSLTAFFSGFAFAEEKTTEEKITYVVIPVLDTDIKTDDCRFSLEVRANAGKDRDEFVEILSNSQKVLNENNKVKYVSYSDDVKNKIVIHAVELSSPDFQEFKQSGISPFVHGLVDVVIDGKLAGRYYVYGNAYKGLVYDKDKNINGLLKDIAKYCNQE